MSHAKSILFVDGNEKDRQYYAHRPRSTSPDYGILEASTGQAALDLYYSQSIDCVIMELTLPDMSGFELLAKLIPFARHPEIPVVVLTLFTNQALLEVAKMNGAFATLHKGTTSGGDLDKIVHKAMATIPKDQNKRRSCQSHK